MYPPLLLLVWDRDRVLSESGARCQRTGHPLFSDIEHFAILGISRQYQFYSLTIDTYIAIGAIWWLRELSY